MDKIVKQVKPPITKMNKREFDMNAYLYFERSKDFLCRVYNLDFYNPTDIKNEYMEWLLKNKERGDRYIFDEYNKPFHVIDFIQSSNFN